MKAPCSRGRRGPGGFSGSCGRSDPDKQLHACGHGVKGKLNRGLSVGRQRRSGPSMSDWGCWAGLVHYFAGQCTPVWSHTREDPKWCHLKSVDFYLQVLGSQWRSLRRELDVSSKILWENLGGGREGWALRLRDTCSVFPSLKIH